MRSLNSLALFASVAALAGCSDDPSVNGVFPSSAFVGRTLRVEVSGDNVSWSSGTTLDFGPGVTVANVQVASPTTIFADVTIGATERPGLRDVIVRKGSDSLTLNAAFELQSPLDMKFEGKLAQGSVVSFTARNLDFGSPFDATCGVSFFGICLQYSNMELVTSQGVNAVVGSVDDYVVSGTLYIDTDAVGGSMSLVSGPADKTDEQVTSPLGKNVDVAARTAAALSSGSPTTATVSEAFASDLYVYESSGMTLSRFKTTSRDPNASPSLYILPESGHFLDMISSGDEPHVVAAGSTKFFAVWVDPSGATGYTYDVKVNPLPLTALHEAANDTAAAAQVSTLQTIYFGPATLSAKADQDWIKLPVSTSDSTKSVHVFTTGADPMTDTTVEIYKNTGDAANMIGQGDDSGYHEDVVSDVIGAGVTSIYVTIGASDYFVSEHNAYFAVIWVE